MIRSKDGRMIRELAERHGLERMFEPEVLADMELRIYADKETVCTVGERLDSLYVVAEGRLKVYTLLPNGKTVLVRFCRPPALIGDVEWMAGYPVKNIVEAEGECSLLAVSRSLLLEKEMDNPAFLRFMIRNLSHKLYTLGNTSAINLLYPVENRFASYLLSMQPEKRGTPYAEEIRTSSITETAEMLGTSYRHLNRVIAGLVREGVLERKKGRILIKDEARLRELGSHNPYL